MVVSQIRRTMNNLVDVVGGELLLRVANLGVAVLIGRVFGAATLGNYAAILAVATATERLSDNGLEMTGIAEASRQPRELNTIASALYLDKTVLSSIAIGLLALVAWMAKLSGGQWVIAVILTTRTFLYSYCRLNTGLLKALDKTRYIVRIQALHFTILAIGLLTVYLRQKSLTVVLLCLLGAQAVEFVLTFGVLRSLGLRFSFVPLSACWQLVRRSAPVGMTYTFSTLMMRGDTVVLSLIATAGVVGTFAAANTGLVVVYVIAWLFSGILLSDLGRLSRDREGFNLHFRRCVRGVMMMTVPVAVVSVLLAPFVLVSAFGRNFVAASLPGALMMVALPFIFLNATFLSRAIARNASHLALAIYGFTSILSLLLNYFLGRWQGPAGVAATVVIREAVMTLAFVRFRNLPDRSVEAGMALKGNPEFAAMLNS